ncbi:MAG: Gfo/Idh/MocA family oxidoreductase, partial [Alphaproteobacteria bacterium]|nr:Gfo/Idh/MocA family oxidoreductase [Alphaproteobacteria bacterium]
MAEEIGIGLIGTGFMGKCHALAFGAVAATTDPTLRPRLELLCDTDGDHAAAMARQFGFSRATTDWRELVTDPAVDIVSITAPNALHHDMAVTAAQAGKHVYCEKPMALTVANASAMADAVAEARVKSLVGYNYLRNPAIAYARQMIGDGELGDVFSFRGIFDEDFMANAATPFSWRCRGADSGAGALGDMATHL